MTRIPTDQARLLGRAERRWLSEARDRLRRPGATPRARSTDDPPATTEESPR